MLDLAYKYEEEIRRKMLDTWYDEKYMFYHTSAYHEMWQNPNPEDGDKYRRQFVSIDSNGNVLGVIVYHLDCMDNLVDGLGAINFTDNKVIFGRDLAQVIDDIFCKFNIRKLCFSVIVGNPIEKSYDKMVTKYGGRTVGVFYKDTKLIDGNYYDHKYYEIFREDYIKAKERLHGKK